MDDSAMYTGVDSPVGMFDNEQVSQEVAELAKEQDRLLKELTPQLEKIVEMLDKERQIIIDYITTYVDTTKDDDPLLRAELKAAAMYRKYLDDLKTKFSLNLNQTKGK